MSKLTDEDFFLPPELKDKVSLQDFLRFTDDQWDIFTKASFEEKCVYRSKVKPRCDFELDWYTKNVLGISFPKTCHPECVNKTIPCTAPFKVFSDAFFARYPVIILKGARGSGKAQGLSNLVLTPKGYTEMRHIVPGSKVIDSDGNVVNVTHIHPQGVKQLYRVHFNDGTSTECCEEHLWTCRVVGKNTSKINGSKKDKKWQVKSTKELSEDLFIGVARKDRKWRIPVTAAVDFPHKNLELDPYALGLLLGDGGLTSKTPHYSCHPDDFELVASLAESLHAVGVSPKSVKDGRNQNYSLSKIDLSFKNNGLTDVLKKLCLYKTNSHTKFIPEEYKYSSKEQRLAILQGLLDTDGYCNKSAIDYVSASKQLCEDVKFLVQSLGGTAVQSEKYIKGYEHPYYRLYIKMSVCPFRMKRKVEKWAAPSKYPVTRIITSIEKAHLEEAQCITVDSPTSTYLTNDCIVTHNSFLMATLALVEQICLDAEVLVLGGSERQAKVVFNYISQKINRFKGQFWDSPNAPKALMNPKDELQTVSKIISGGSVTSLPASETSIYGQRPARLRIDECDKCKLELVEGSIPCCHPREGVRNQILLASTHYAPNGTLTAYIDRAYQLNEDAGEIVMPVYQFCYKDALFENGGYLTPQLISDMKKSVNKQTWERQFENGEPAVEGCLFSTDDLDIVFDDSLGVFESDFNATYEHHESTYNKDDYDAIYCGCDFGDKRDWTIISKFASPKKEGDPDILVKWVRSGRCGLKCSAKRYNDVLCEEECSAAHDATGASGFVSEELTEYSEPIVWNKKWKHEALNDFIVAVETHQIRLPRIPYIESCLKYVTWEEAFGDKHLPDTLASLILAWYARRRVFRVFNIGGSRA